MKTSIILSLCCIFLFAGSSSCEKDPFPVPPCIQQKIDSIRNSAKRTPPAEVHVWNYAGRNVYLLNVSSSTEFVKVFDENCQYICSPSGGPSNYGDSLCTDFYQDAKYIGSVFRDDR